MAVAFSWFVILCVAALLCFLNGVSTKTGDANDRDLLKEATLRMVVQLFMTNERFGVPDPSLEEQIQRDLHQGPIPARLVGTIVECELRGPETALGKLGELREKTAELSIQWEARWLEVAALLERLYAAQERQEFDAIPLDAGEQDALRAELGWFGSLALAPESFALHNSEASRAREELVQRAIFSASFMILGGLLLCGYILAGCGLLLYFMVRLVRRPIVPDRPLAGEHGGVYAETFAIWMVLFFALQLSAGLVPPPFLPHAILAAFLASLTALAWPVLRGIPWATVRDDIGWRSSRPVRDAGAGVIAHASVVPIYIFVSIVIGIILSISSQAGAAPQETFESNAPTDTHFELFLDGGGANAAVLFLLLAVAAPIVEETFFRGVLYAHLRHASHRWGRIASVLLSVLVTSVLFASLHMQSAAYLPLLGVLGGAFALVRETRKSLLPAIAAHAVHNGAIAVLAIALFV